MIDVQTHIKVLVKEQEKVLKMLETLGATEVGRCQKDLMAAIREESLKIVCEYKALAELNNEELK